jgi:hypothetical protein
VYKERGNPWDHQCINCDKPAEHWSHRKDGEREDPYNYDPRCVACHNKYDDTGFKKGHKTSTGEKNPKAKLTEEEVIEIRKLYSEGWIYYELAYVFNVSEKTIDDIIKRRTWRHI